jgi:hypothetical protein
MRKAFWVKNQKSNRIYHISLDCCLGLPGELYQVEVEYTGKYGKKNEKSDVKEEEIIDDIAKITKSLIDKFPSLKPSTKTKKRWLIQD